MLMQLKHFFAFSITMLLLPSIGKTDEYQQYIRISCIPEINRMEFQVLDIHAKAEPWDKEDIKKEAELQEKFGLYRAWKLMFKSKEPLDKTCDFNGKTVRMIGKYSDHYKKLIVSGVEPGIDLDVYENGKHIIHYGGFGSLFRTQGLNYYDTPNLVYDETFEEVHVCGENTFSSQARQMIILPCVRIWPQQGVNFVGSKEIFNVLQRASSQIFNQNINH